MYQKILALTAGLFLLAGMTACNSNNPDPETIPTPSTTAPMETLEETTLPAIVFEETVLVDDENCTFAITAIREDSILGYTLNAYLENRTDLDLTFTLRNVSVNGFMCDPLWSATVTAGMKSNETISFSKDAFERNSIDDVTEIVFTLDVYDSNNWSSEHLLFEGFCLYPMGKDAVQIYEREPQASDLVLFDNEECTMIVTGFDPDDMWGYTMNVYLVNKTDKSLMFSVQEAAVNGFMCDPFWASTVAAGKASNTNITWFTSTLEEAGITEVESLTLPVRVYEADNWMAADILNETFTVQP